MRLPSERRTWWKLTSLASVALYSFTGIVTSPKLMAPFQMDLTRAPYPLIAKGRPVPGCCASLLATDGSDVTAVWRCTLRERPATG